MKKEMKGQLFDIVFDYFSDLTDKQVHGFISSFAFHSPSNDGEITQLIESFIESNGLSEAYTNYLMDFVVDKDRTEFFRRTASSEVEMIQSLKECMLHYSYYRYGKLLNSGDEITKLSTTIKKIKGQLSKLTKNYNFMKNELVSIYERLNEGGIYFYNEQEDKELLKKIRNL